MKLLPLVILLLCAFASPVRADMYQDGSNAKVPSGGGAPASFVCAAANGALVKCTAPAFYVSTTGSDSNDCLAATVTGGHGPCLTIQHTFLVAAQYDAGNSNVIINVGAGSFAGLVCSGNFRGTAGSGISGQYVFISGAGSGSTTITRLPGEIFNINVSTGCQMVLKGLTLSVTSGGWGLFVQNNAYANLDGDVAAVGSSGAAVAHHAEAGGIIEYTPIAGQPVTISGTFNTAFSSDTGGYLEFDPAPGGVISFGGGLTTTTIFSVTDLGKVYLGQNWSFLGPASGLTATLTGNGVLANETGNPLPGNGYSVSTGAVVRPALGVDYQTATSGFNPVGTSSATLVMMGLGSTVKFQAGVSGRALFQMSGSLQNETQYKGAAVILAYGTGTAPSNGAAVTGTLSAAQNRYSTAALAGAIVPFSLQWLLTGLTPGTTYWGDLPLAAGGAGTASATNVTATIINLPAN